MHEASCAKYTHVGRLLPIVPELNHSVDEVVAVRYRPTCVESVTQQVVLLVRGHKFGPILRVVKALQDVQEDVLIIADELWVGHVVEQAFDVIRRSRAVCDQLLLDHLRASIFENSDHGFELVARSLMLGSQVRAVLVRIVSNSRAVP